MVSFLVLDQFVSVVSGSINVNIDALNEYKIFNREKSIGVAIKFRTEQHHILPKSEAKRAGIPKGVYNNSSINLVHLLSEDHAIAHVLLARALPTQRLCYIVISMLNFREMVFSEIMTGDYIKLAKEYSDIRKKSSEYQSEVLRGKTFSIETRKKMSLAAKGKVISDDSRKKMSLSQKGKKRSEETRAKHRKENLSIESRFRLSKGHKPMLDEEKRIRSQRMREIMINKPKSDIHKIKLAEANNGKRWYNNGIIEIQIDETDNTILDGFVRGKLPTHGKKVKGARNSNAGNFKWTDGKVEIRSKVCPGDNFVRGSLSTYEPPQDLFSYGGI